MVKKENIKVFKIGGKVVNDPDLLHKFINRLSLIEGKKIIVHGGGNKASKIMTQMGVEVKMVEGRRITNEATLEIVTMVYAGLINKKLVSLLQANGINSVGLSGADANSIQAHKREVKSIDYGFVGDIDQINSESVINLLEAGFIPVFCSITHDKKGQLLNTNADTIASSLASALSRECDVELKFCFELKGVLMDKTSFDSLISNLREVEVDQLHRKGVINDGMIPKLQNGFDALRNGVAKVSICHVDELHLKSSGTNLIL